MSHIKNTYKRRDSRKNYKINFHKTRINEMFWLSSIKKGRYVVIDSEKQQTRNILENNNVPSYNIHSVGYHLKDNGINIHRTSFKDFATNTNIQFTNIWCDTIQTPNKAVKELEPLFARNVVSSTSIVFLTSCLRGITHIEFTNWYANIKKMVHKYGFLCSSIKLPSHLRILTKSNSKYNILPNMTDNGAYKKTGRTITIAFRVRKIKTSLLPN
jgi:hypothetical protein